MRRAARTRTILLASVAALSVVLVACGGSGTVEISRQSDPRPDASDGPDGTQPIGDTGPYCDAASGVRDSIEALDEDPEAGLELLGDLADVAPEQLRDDFEVAIDGLSELEGLDEDDPSSFSKVLEIMLAPELLEALGSIDAFTLEQCGFTLDPDAEVGQDTEGGGDFFEPDDDLLDDELFGDEETSVSLEDVDAIEEQNDGASWASKLSGTFILGGSDVQLSADLERFTDDEALELCEVMRAGLSTKNPDVRITVLNGDEPLASSGDDGTCSLS